MALNYQRIGWEDAPSTNTPLDAANLNHMDNGIVALSNEFDRVVPGLEEIAETVSPLLPDMSTMIEDISTLQGQTSSLATQAQHILGNFATVEEGETASANYSTGQHVVLGDYLYKVTDDIAQGESFVENTNIVKTTVGSEVEGLKSEIDELNSNISPIKRTDYSVYTSNWQSTRQPIVYLYQYGRLITLSVTGGTQTAGKDTKLLSIPSDIVPLETIMFPVFQYYNTPKIVGVFRISANSTDLIINHDQDMTTDINFVSCNLHWFI